MRLVPQIQHKSVLQIHPRGSALEACARTTVMTLEGNLVVSVALSDSQKQRRMKLLKAQEETKEVLAQQRENVAPTSADNNSGTDTRSGNSLSSTGSVTKAGARKTETSEASSTPPSSGKKSLAGTIFDKSETSKTLKTQKEVNSQNMKYAGGLIFAALIGFMAWYMKKRRNRFNIDEDNIDILSSKRLSTHQTLMVARVNGSRFLLAVGDKAVTSLGLIPVEGQGTQDLARNIRADVSSAVKESLAKEPKISATPYSEIKDDHEMHGESSDATSNFGSNFQQAIEKIVRERNNPARRERSYNDAPSVPDSKALSDAISQKESPSNVSGLISMARMRAALENNSTSADGQYRA